jgi:hypothetical protein
VAAVVNRREGTVAKRWSAATTARGLHAQRSNIRIRIKITTRIKSTIKMKSLTASS